MKICAEKQSTGGESWVFGEIEKWCFRIELWYSFTKKLYHF